jgi:hypothetical protein
MLRNLPALFAVLLVLVGLVALLTWVVKRVWKA